MRVLFALTFTALTAHGALADCGREAIDGAISRDEIDFPTRSVIQSSSEFSRDSGFHQRVYNVFLKDDLGDSRDYEVRVFEYEEVSAPCTVDSAVRVDEGST